jgi:hypothetical protein
MVLHHVLFRLQALNDFRSQVNLARLNMPQKLAEASRMPFLPRPVPCPLAWHAIMASSKMVHIIFYIIHFIVIYYYYIL